VSKTFEQKMDRSERTLQQFLDSQAFKECLIAHLCHTRKWHYNHQTLKVELLPNGKWNAPSDHSWSRAGSCIVTLTQLSDFRERMREIGEERDFEDILASDPEEARTVAERLYAFQESHVRERALYTFAWMKEREYWN
jgi:hypothetical protein